MPARRWAFPASTATSGTTTLVFPASTSATSAEGSAGTNWYQFDTTFQMSKSWPTTAGRTTCAAGSICGRWRLGAVRRTTRAGVSIHRRPLWLFGRRLHARPPIERHSTDRSDSGARRRMAQRVFVNDVWQASRNLTLSLGLRYELNTPVQTYAGVASMLTKFETIIPSANMADYPFEGFKFHEANYKDIAPRLGATYRWDKTVVRADRDLLQPESDELVHVPDQQSAGRRGDDLFDGSNESICRSPPRRDRLDRRAVRTSSRQRAICRTRARISGAWICSGAGSWPGAGHPVRGIDTSHLDRSFFNNTPTPGPGSNIDARRPSQNSDSAGSSPTI